MSVRIHQLAKQIDMENKELLELLQSRGFEVKSVSSTIDNISAESLIKEFLPDEKAEKAPESTDKAVEEKKKQKTSVFPEGVIVKSAEEIKREREASSDKNSPKAQSLLQNQTFPTRPLQLIKFHPAHQVCVRHQLLQVYLQAKVLPPLPCRHLWRNL